MSKIYCIGFTQEDDLPYKFSFDVDEEAVGFIKNHHKKFGSKAHGIYATAKERDEAFNIIKKALKGKLL